jgi:hypothetical protein
MMYLSLILTGFKYDNKRYSGLTDYWAFTFLFLPFLFIYIIECFYSPVFKYMLNKMSFSYYLNTYLKELK